MAEVFEPRPLLSLGGGLKYAVTAVAVLGERLFVGCDDGALRLLSPTGE